MADISILDPLPIDAQRGRIERAVAANPVVILQAETGAGKSTRIPMFLLDSAPYVIVTQPRRIAAAAIAKRVAEEMNVELGTTVGYWTATERKATDETRLLYCTDGLEVMQQIFDSSKREGAIVIIDEAHEWNMNLELLVAWFRLKIERGFNIRLVIMSATIEAELLATYFDNAEVISSTGRTYPIRDTKIRGGVLRATESMLQEGHNVLVFMPGKGEIRRLMRRLRNLNLNAEIIPLHADLSGAEQDACFKEYDRPKCVVATNVAQSSITVPDIDAVVDSGMERRLEVVDGIEGLYLRAISLADREQRKGRAGRVKPGVYVDCCPIDVGQRKAFPRPAILSQSLENLVLRLATVGLDPEDVRFFHRPVQERIDAARETLIKLGCLQPDHQVTEIGKLTASFPIGFRASRMIAETFRRRHNGGWVDEQVMTLAVILREGSVRNRRGSDGWMQYAPPPMHGGMSDAYMELSAFEVAQTLPFERLSELGIDEAAFERIREERLRVLGTLATRNIRVRRLKNVLPHRAVVAALKDRLYRRSQTGNSYTVVGNHRSTPRKLPDDSCVRGAEYVVGIPWNLENRSEFGSSTKRLILGATEVAPELIEEMAQ